MIALIYLYFKKWYQFKIEPSAMAVKDLLLAEKSLQITGIIRIESENERFLGPGRIELLENIIETGSISQAAKKMGMSYKKAWDLINSMNKQTKMPIVITHAGGENGGGTLVTEEGKKIIAAFKKLDDEFRQSFAEKLSSFLNQP